MILPGVVASKDFRHVSFPAPHSRLRLSIATSMLAAPRADREDAGRLGSHWMKPKPSASVVRALAALVLPLALLGACKKRVPE